jgi:hypothetical protein
MHDYVPTSARVGRVVGHPKEIPDFYLSRILRTWNHLLCVTTTRWTFSAVRNVPETATLWQPLNSVSRTTSSSLATLIACKKMGLQVILYLLSIGSAIADPIRSAPACRYIPGDSGWPSIRSWKHLNATVGGRLVATVPVAHVCHEGGPFSGYNETACAELQQSIQFDGAATLYVIPI